MNSADMTPPRLSGESGDAVEAPEVDDPNPAGTPPRRRRRWWLWGLGSAVLVGAVLAAFFVPTSRVLLEPGSVRPTESRISVGGAKAYDDRSDVLFTTVYVDRATLFGLARSYLDDAIEVHSQEEIYGREGRDASQKVNQQEMDLSKLVATREALKYLGYDAKFTADGALVTEVVPGTAADGHLRPGDVIVAVDGTPIALPSDLHAALAPHAPGQGVTVTVKRAGEPAGESAASGPKSGEVDVALALGPAADDPARAVLGVSVQPESPRVDAPVMVAIDSGTVTGPSAGLAWSLGIIDRLTPGALAGRGDIAVTGEIKDDGSVGVIGGIVQKVATVKRSGVKKFLYPAATPKQEQDQMRRIAGDELELVPVATLADAVHYLAPDGLKVPATAGAGGN
jgi:PDZ domain-containing protein